MKWTWSKVGTIHADPGCPGEIRSYRYRYYPPDHTLYERCIGLAWCSTCREYTGTMAHVPRSEHLPDPLAALPPDEHERVYRGETRLLDHLDRQARRGAWPQR